MLEKLINVEKRFDEISSLLCQQEVVNDVEKYTKLIKRRFLQCLITYI